MDEITINGEVYVKKSATNQLVKKRDGMEYVIVRPKETAVYAGYLESRDGNECVLRDARRIWCQYGAEALTQMAVNGIIKPENSEFAVVVDKIWILDAVEIIPCTAKAQESIEEVPEWRS